jgi:hypothetical protein
MVCNLHKCTLNLFYSVLSVKNVLVIYKKKKSTVLSQICTWLCYNKRGVNERKYEVKSRKETNIPKLMAGKEEDRYGVVTAQNTSGVSGIELWRRFPGWDFRSGDITQHTVDFLTLKMGPIGCPKTPVWNYNSTLHNIPEERRSHLQSGGSLKSRIVTRMFYAFFHIA